LHGAVRREALTNCNDHAVLDEDILPRPQRAVDDIDDVDVANHQAREFFPGFRQRHRPHHANRESCRGNSEQHRKPTQYPDYPISHYRDCTEIAARSDPQSAAALP